MTNHAKIVIVIINYLNTQVTIDCLHSLALNFSLNKQYYHVVVFENGTGQKALALLQETIEKQQWGNWVELQFSSVNLGFTGGNNRVIQHFLTTNLPPEYFFLLNSDTLVNDVSIKSLIEFMDAHSTCGICGSQLLSETGDIQASPFRFPSITSEFENGLRLGFLSRLLTNWNVVMLTPAQPCAVDWVSGASMMLRREMLEQIGLFDEGFFTYFEDVDLCKRAWLKGWQVWYAPQSRVIHLEGASSGIVSNSIKRRPSYWFLARRRFYLKHYGALHSVAIDAVFIVSFALWRLRRMLQGKPDNDPPFMLYDYISHSVIFNGFKMPIVKFQCFNKL